MQSVKNKIDSTLYYMFHKKVSVNTSVFVFMKCIHEIENKAGLVGVYRNALLKKSNIYRYFQITEKE